MSSGIPFHVVAVLIIAFTLIACRKDIKRPLLVTLLLGICALLYVIGRLALQHAWANVFLAFLGLALYGTAFCLFEKGILGPRGDIMNRNMSKFEERHPRLFRFQKKHARLPKSLLHGSICSAFILGISGTLMTEYEAAWASLRVIDLVSNERLAHHMIVSEGMNSPLESLLVMIFIWCGASATVVFVASLFTRGSTSVCWSTVAILALYVLIAPMSLTLLQKLCLAFSCGLSAYISNMLCFFDISERICGLFSPNRRGK